MNKGYEIVKRIIDIILSLCGLIIASPILLITAIAITIETRGGAIFKQERIGMNGKPFTIYKFRSMVVNKEPDHGFSVASDSRITKVGKVIRRLKIDELPQLFNVLKGDMSFVGPRPYIYNDFKYNKEEEMKVLDGIRPGITGLASYVYKHENYILEHAKDKKDYYTNVLLKEKSKLNLEYKKYRSFMVDLKIMLATCKIIKGVRLTKDGPLYVPADSTKVEEYYKEKDIK